MKLEKGGKGTGRSGGRIVGSERNQAALYDSSGLSLWHVPGPNAEGRWCSMPRTFYLHDFLGQSPSNHCTPAGAISEKQCLKRRHVRNGALSNRKAGVDIWERSVVGLPE